jgi:hypothetical protein
MRAAHIAWPAGTVSPSPTFISMSCTKSGAMNRAGLIAVHQRNKRYAVVSGRQKPMIARRQLAPDRRHGDEQRARELELFGRQLRRFGICAQLRHRHALRRVGTE